MKYLLSNFKELFYRAFTVRNFRMQDIRWLGIGLLLVLQACATYKGENEQYLALDPDKVERYVVTLPFSCTTPVSKNLSWQARQSFRNAERSFSKDIPLEEKIALYEKALELGETKSLKRMLILYEAYASNHQKMAEGADYENYMSEIIETINQMINTYDLPEGYSAYAKLKLEGELLHKDEIKARNYIYHAALRGDLDALLMLGDYYMYVEGNYFKGKEAYDCAAKQDNLRADRALAKSYEIFEENYPKALENHSKAAENGSQQSLLELRATFRDGLKGYHKNPELAMCFHWFHEAYLLKPNQPLPGFRWSCPLPPHPELDRGNLPYDEELKSLITSVEREFNPNPIKNEVKVITPLVEMMKKADQKKQQENQLLKSLRAKKNAL